MSWEDQGRQEHGWFGHGTAPPKVKDETDKTGGGQVTLTLDELDARIHAAIEKARREDAAAARAYAWTEDYGAGSVEQHAAHVSPAIAQRSPGDIVLRVKRAWRLVRGRTASVCG